MERLLRRHPDAPELRAIARVVCGPFGSAVTEADYTAEGIPLLRISDLTAEGEIDESEMRFIPAGLADQLSSTQVHPGDLVISQRGTLGTPAVVPATRPKWNISANLIAIRDLRGVPPEFLQFFLSSAPGRDQIERRQSGQVNAKITTGDVAEVRIPVPPDAEAMVRELEDAREDRRGKLAEAEGLLAGLGSAVMDALDLVLPPVETRLTFAAQRGMFIADARLDSDYFHPERTITLALLERHAARLHPARLDHVAVFAREQVAPSQGLRYVGLADVHQNTGEIDPTPRELPDGPCYTFAEGDILFSRLRPNLNKVYRAEFGGICSPEFHVVRVLPEHREHVQPDYLAAVLRAPLTLAQTRHMMTGNTHPRLAPEDIRKLRVPVPEPAVQERVVAELQHRRHEARRLRLEAVAGWADARARFEARLLGEPS